MSAPLANYGLRDAMRGELAERAHRAAISIHCPNQSEIGMAARCDLAALRDRAAAGQRVAGDEAGQMLAIVARLATDAVYAGVPDHQLIRIHGSLTLAFDAAREIERCLRD